MLVLENIHTHYGKIEALHGVSVEIQKGEIVSLIGANGAGKTTLLMTVCGDPQASSGRVLFKGEDITHKPTAQIMRSGIAIVPEGRRVFPGLTVEENLHMGGFFTSKQEIRKSQDHVFELFPRLKERRNQRAGTMSGGEQQMLAIGRGMMAEPELLILDEPSLGLSPLLVEEMFTLIQALRDQGITIMLVEQNVVQSLEIASRAYIIEDGVVTISGTAAEIFDNDELRRSYLGL